MHGKSFRIVGLILAIMLVALVVAIPAYASPALQGGTGGNGANSGNNAMGDLMAGVNDWQTLLPGQTQEWILDYGGGNDNANIEVGMNPSNSIGFNVFTDQQWRNADVGTPLGRGTQRTTFDTGQGQSVIANNGDLFWATSSPGGTQRYHIQVFSRSQQPAQYWINSFGPGVTSLTAYRANAANQNLQGQLTQTGASGQAGTGTGTSAQNGGATIQNTGGTNNSNLGAPRTLPVTGGMDFVWLLLAAALLMIAGGWLTRRQAN